MISYTPERRIARRMLSMRDSRQPCARCEAMCGSISDWRSATPVTMSRKKPRSAPGINFHGLETMVQKLFENHAQVTLRHVHLVECLHRGQSCPRSGRSRRRSIVRAGFAAILKIHWSSFQFNPALRGGQRRLVLKSRLARSTSRQASAASRPLFLPFTEALATAWASFSTVRIPFPKGMP